MNTTSWYMMLVALGVGVLLSVNVSKFMSRPLPKYKKLSERTVRSTENRTAHAPVPKAATPQAQSAASQEKTPSMTQSDWDDLWKKSLFKDSRTEETPNSDQQTADVSHGNKDQVI